MKYDAHDHQVMLRINRHIEVVNRKHPTASIEIKLGLCRNANIEERRVSAATSRSTIGRDADYYFAGREGVGSAGNVLTKTVVAVGGQVVKPLYDGLKGLSKVSEALGGKPLIRTDANRPNAPIGGTLWMTRGEIDGFGDEGSRVAPLSSHAVD